MHLYHALLERRHHYPANGRAFPRIGQLNHAEAATASFSQIHWQTAADIGLHIDADTFYSLYVCCPDTAEHKNALPDDHVYPNQYSCTYVTVEKGSRQEMFCYIGLCNVTMKMRQLFISASG